MYDVIAQTSCHCRVCLHSSPPHHPFVPKWKVVTVCWSQKMVLAPMSRNPPQVPGPQVVSWWSKPLFTDVLISPKIFHMKLQHKIPNYLSWRFVDGWFSPFFCAFLCPIDKPCRHCNIVLEFHLASWTNWRDKSVVKPKEFFFKKPSQDRRHVFGFIDLPSGYLT